MAILLDSAHPEDARAAADLGFVLGATTNPALLRAAGVTPEEAIGALANAGLAPVFYQLTAATAEAREAEARHMLGVQENIIGIKVPCTTENLALAAHFADEGYTIAVTAIFSASQALLACEAGADFLIPYVNRSTRLLGDGLELVRQLRAVVDAADTGAEIIAASIKSADEAVGALLAGAHHLTLPLALIRELGEHELSREAIREFGRK